MVTRPVRRSLSSSLATTRSQMRPTVSQSMRRNLTIVVLSVLVARYPATSSKSRVNPERCRAKGTASVTTPQVGHCSRRSLARTITIAAPKSRWRHVEATGQVS
jgi:hypothetical protein